MGNSLTGLPLYSVDWFTSATA